jgi:hypothetical protein
MAKKAEQMTDTKLALVSPQPEDLVPYCPARESSAPATRAEARMVQEQRKQQCAIEYQKAKTILALRCVGEIHQSGNAVFTQDMRHQEALREAAGAKSYQALVEEFADFAAKLEAQHIYRIMDTGAYNIGAIVAQSTYRPDEPEPEKKRTGLQRLLGG